METLGKSDKSDLLEIASTQYAKAVTQRTITGGLTPGNLAYNKMQTGGTSNNKKVTDGSSY